ncbi:pyruvate dehydrogenase (acetyl-transferring) E1 component subunit alpha [Rhodococcus wratislaviensis]|uniref:pyruvate dehydrogenase (acetyl-transferring) E1 component subunit alpha n=1 Tax=Rhodococcus wratislaviensis TaxID=44752 RepID=UPI000DD36AD5|nr:pyruvate dehydrogenase (acetyl-transferring) E1 component subunit alpha [Rhodococcus wratislaviensis]
MHLEVVVTLAEPPVARPYRKFLPAERAVQYLDAAGELTESEARYPRPADDRLVEMYRNMVLGRRFDQQATALTKQGRLAVYPSSRGQEACQIAAAMSLHPGDWMFPTYRDSVALAARGIDPVQILSMLAGDWHCGYDPAAHRSAPQCTPLATQLLHATGVAYGEHRKGNDTVALAFCGDGATSEGDFHEALNFAAVFKAPVVFLVQNNGFAISVPLARQSAAPSLAHKGVGYGIGSEQVDGNDPVAMLAVMDEAARFVRAGNGPVIVEAHTYRIDAHTNADDATRYRDSSEVEQWLGRDPLARLEKYLRGKGLLDDAAADALTAGAEVAAAELRAGMNVDRAGDPMDLFRYVFAEPTPQLREQQAQVQAELAAESEEN